MTRAIGGGMVGQAVLRRKAGSIGAAQRRTAEAGRALPLAVARAAQEAIGLALEVGEVEAARISLAELLELTPLQALFAIVEGPSESLGLVLLSPPVLAAAIERQTIGRVTAAVPPPRRPTRTDAAMTAGFVDRVMAELAAAVAGGPDAAWAAGYRYASYLDDPRPLGLILEDVAYRLFRLHARLGRPPAKRGEVMIALPAAARPASRPPTGRRAGADSGAAVGEAGQRERAAAGAQAAAAEAEAWARALEAAVMGASARLDAVLDRVQLPLSAVLTLRPGTVLPLPAASIDRLVLEGPGHRPVAAGRLGQARGLRALRIAAGEAPALPGVPAAGPG